LISTLVPYLEYQQKGRPLRRISLQKFPFRIGRSPRADHTIASQEVSTQHAEIVKDGEGFVLRDLNSTNGTFVNAERIESCALKNGDLVHFASEEHRFGLAERTLAQDDEEQATIWRRGDTERDMRETHDLGRVLGLRAVSAVFQPIVRLSDRVRTAYETLGRITIEEGRYSIGETLRIADERGQAARLSRLIRGFAIADFQHLPERPVEVFFNLHPAEMADLDETFLEFKKVAAGLGDGQRAVLEIHEGAVTDPKTMRLIRERVRDLNISLAYDDFGAGQSRLMELAEVPPDYLKLDMSLVRDIDRSTRRQDLVRALVSVMCDLGIAVIAEGIERAEEADVAQQLGCALGQGFFLGRPAKCPQPVGSATDV
jgi:EAL domain-containing protein (putative c-di-GMP-specific phosphodiesterase class I)